MNSKNPLTRRSSNISGQQVKKLKALDTDSVFHKCMEESGLTLKHPPEKCLASSETVLIVRNIKKNLQKQFDYPRNLNEVFSCVSKECEDNDVLKHYLFPNIIRQSDDNFEEHPVSDSVFKILLSVPLLQNKLIDFLFEKVLDFAVEGKCGPWIQMILKCLSSLDTIVNSDKVASNLVNLLDVTTEKIVRLEIITAIPDIVSDSEHENIANELSRFLTEDHDLIPAILECLSYLCLGDDQYERLQKKTLTILTTLPKCMYFPNFVKFLLMSSRVNDEMCLEVIQGLRNALGWPTASAKAQEIATSQVLTVSSLRNCIVSSKTVGNALLKTILTCKIHTDHKPIDIVILLILYTTTEERQRQVENLIKKQIKLNVLKENLLNDAFEKYKPIFKEHLLTFISLSNSLLKSNTDSLVESFASHIYMLLLSELDECRQTVIAELLQLGLDRKQCVMTILLILNNVAEKDMSLLKPQSLQMLTLLDRMDGMSLAEIKAVMNLVCGLAYSFENSIIRDDIHMIIRKELGSSSPTIKVQGILAGVYAVKYLMITDENEENTVDMPDDISYSSVTYLTEGPLREAAQIIELISRSTRLLPDMIAFFYDELSDVVSNATHINKHFMAWLTDAVTNDLQQHFIVDSITNNKIGQLKLSMQYCLNDDSEMDEMIAINIAGLALESKDEVYVGIISPLFQLIQTLHYRQHEGNLSSIDALLGCAVVMPQYDIDLLEDMDTKSVTSILDCLVHCTNWFRELLNAFATQNDDALKSKILKRILHIEEVELTLSQILMQTHIAYKPPVSNFDISKYTGQQTTVKQIKAQPPKQKPQKRNAPDDTVLPETCKSQATQANNVTKNKGGGLHNISLRNLSLKILNLFNNDISDGSDHEGDLNMRTFKFLLICVNSNLENVLISKIKKKSFLVKQETIYDPKKAEKCAQKFSEILPKIVEHLNYVTTHIDNKYPQQSQEDNSVLFTSEIIDYLDSLENLYKMLTIYFKWMGFRNHHTALLKSSLRTIASNQETSNIVTLKDLTISVAKYLQAHEKYCLQLSVALALVEFVETVQSYSESITVLKILRGMSSNFLSQAWKTIDGVPEKGLVFNQSVDKLAAIHFLNNEVVALKNLTLQLTGDIKILKGKNDTLSIMKCINKSNFPVLFRNLGSAVHEAVKSRLNKGLTNDEHLDLWKDVVTILKYMSEIAKTLESRNNLSAFFKKSLPILKLFLTQGIPIIELQFKNNTQEVLEIMKILQQSTRFLQSLCCHSRLKKDSALMSKVPFMRQLLETLIYKVKAALAANNCSEAFWMGNLKNKNIHGEIIATQQSVESEESVDDCDDQLPEDEDDEDSDNEMLNPDSKSVSDVL